MKIKNLLIGAALLAGFGLTSCSSDDNGGPQSYIDFVTLDHFNEAGATMSFRQSGDSPLITLTTNQKFTTSEFKVGDRIVISYEPSMGLRYVSGPVVLFEAVVAEGRGSTPVKGNTIEYKDWATDEVAMQTINRSGQYLDMTFISATAAKAPKIQFVLDEETENSERPQYRLLFTADTNGSINQYYFYCSYNIEDMWNKETTKGIRIYYKDPANGLQFTDIDKE